MHTAADTVTATAADSDDGDDDADVVEGIRSVSPLSTYVTAVEAKIHYTSFPVASP